VLSLYYHARDDEGVVCLMFPRLTGLWRKPDFLKLWAGETISLVGSRMSAVALPLTAAVTLGASPLQMGLLGTVGVASVALGPFLGVWVDRCRHQPLLVGLSVGRALLLASIPAAALLHLLSFAQLYGVFALHDILSNASGAAYRPFLSTLLAPDEFVEGNSKMAVSSALAAITGPGLAGLLVQAVGGPIAIALDAVSYLVTSLSLALIRGPADAPARAVDQAPMFAQIWDMLGMIWGRPILRAMAVAGSVLSLFQGFGLATYILYLTRDLGLTPRDVGMLYAVGGSGTLIGALVAGPWTRRLGVGPTILTTLLLTSGSALLVPLAGSRLFATPIAVVLLLGAAQVLQGTFLTVYYIAWYSLSQVAAPHRLQGRFTATMATLIFSPEPVGALVGGVLGSLVGLRGTLMIAAAIFTLASLALVRSPLHQVQALTTGEPP